MGIANSIRYFLFFVFCFFIDAHPQEAIIPQNVLKVVNQYFGSAPENDMKITPLLGGHSTLNFCIDLSSKHYVLRFNQRASIERFQCELFAMQEASKLGISPFIVQVFPDEKMVLMDYINGSTMTIERASQVEICIKMARNLKKAHSIKKNPYHGLSRNKIMEKFYTELSNYPEIQMETTQAIEIIRNCHDKIVDMPSHYAVNTHNDLNPGNILVEKDRIFFIDWEGTNWEDPFYDLSYFSIFHNYDQKMESILISNYLDREPSREELYRYYLAKKINFSRISISCYYISFVQNKPDFYSGEINLESWEYYSAMLANKRYENFSVSQFFYKLARVALREAKAIHGNDLCTSYEK